MRALLLICFVTSRLALASLPDIVDKVIPSVAVVLSDKKTQWGWKTTNGAAILVDAGGYFLTARHVIEKAENLSISFDGKSRSPATVIAESASNDLAIVKSKIALGSSVPLAIEKEFRYRLGIPVFAIGHPFGYEFSVSRGIISGLARDITVEARTQRVFQTDAAINGGNSGGPMFAGDGKWIGVVVALRENSCGIGFVVPAPQVAAFLEKYLPPKS